jgi:hypothetical protein
MPLVCPKDLEPAIAALVAERPTGDIVVRPLAARKGPDRCYHGLLHGEAVCPEMAKYMVMWRYER